MSDQPQDRKRSSAEWVTFGVAVVILLLLIGAILSEATKTQQPARPVASLDGTERVGERYAVTVKVKNRGDLAAANVQVLASLHVDGETTEGDQVVDFLAGDDEEDLVFFFADDPGGGALSVSVTGFTVP